VADWIHGFELRPSTLRRVQLSAINAALSPSANSAGRRGVMELITPDFDPLLHPALAVFEPRW
jgi:hypothetical protein